MAQIKIIKPSSKKINNFDTEATNTCVTDTNGNPIYLGDIVKIMPQKAKKQPFKQLKNLAETVKVKARHNM